MQECVLLDKHFQSNAHDALTIIRGCFRKRIIALRSAYDQQAITTDQLHTARKGLLAEAASLLYTHPADDPQAILQKLTTAADLLDKETKYFQVETYLAKLSH